MGRRVATIELTLDIHERRAYLALLGRRPPGFPGFLKSGDFIFESEEESWYEPISLGSDDGQVIEEELKLVSDDGRYALQRNPASVIPLCPSAEYTGYLSDRVLRRGASCAVLCTEELVSETTRYLRSVTQSSCQPRRDQTLPSGWCLFLGIKALQHVPPPPALENLRVETSIKLIPRGGLRIGGRWTWLRGSPPQFELIGWLGEQPIRINGQELQPNNENQIASSYFEEPGQYIIEVGTQLRQRITILEPEINPNCEIWPPGALMGELIVMPLGSWFILCADTGQTRYFDTFRETRLLKPPFLNSWALSIGSGPGATVRHLRKGKTQITNLTRNEFVRNSSLWMPWAELIYQAAIRRPVLSSSSQLQGLALENAWKELVAQAKFVKKINRRGS